MGTLFLPEKYKNNFNLDVMFIFDLRLVPSQEYSAGPSLILFIPAFFKKSIHNITVRIFFVLPKKKCQLTRNPMNNLTLI